jgi:hypothetical protein
MEHRGEKMLTRCDSLRLSLAIVCLSVIVGLTSVARGFVLTPDENGVRLQIPSALYVASDDGHLTRIVALGAAAPGGGTIAYIGAPTFANNGTVFFATQIRTGAAAEWKILRAGLKEPNEVGIGLAMDSHAVRPDCQPILNTEPYVISDGDGTIAFVADRQGGGSALFHYTSGHLTCEVRTGDRTAEGNVVTSIGFGSARAADNGATVLRVDLVRNGPAAAKRRTRRGIVLSMPRAPVREIAVQGDRSHDGLRYGDHFGLPAIAVAGNNVLVAFTNHTDQGSALFMGLPDALMRTVSVGAMVEGRALTYLSDGRPSLDSDSSVAIGAVAGSRRLILVLRNGEPLFAVPEGQKTNSGDQIMGLGDPVATVSGRVYAEGVDQDGRDRIFILQSGASVAPAILTRQELLPSSAAVDRNGKVAFLASQHIDGARSPGEAESGQEGASLQ